MLILFVGDVIDVQHIDVSSFHAFQYSHPQTLSIHTLKQNTKRVGKKGSIYLEKWISIIFLNHFTDLTGTNFKWQIGISRYQQIKISKKSLLNIKLKKYYINDTPTFCPRNAFQQIISSSNTLIYLNGQVY